MEAASTSKCFFEAGVMIHSGVFYLAGTAVKAFGTGARHPVDVCFARIGDAADRCRRQRSKGIGEFPQQAENRFRVTKALLAEEWILKKSFKIWKNFRLILFVSWSRI